MMVERKAEHRAVVRLAVTDKRRYGNERHLLPSMLLLGSILIQRQTDTQAEEEERQESWREWLL